MAAWSSTTLLVRGTFLADATRDSRRSTRKRMSVATALRCLRREPGSGCGDYSPGIPHNRPSGAGNAVKPASVTLRLRTAVSALESVRDGLGHHARDVSAELGDLLAQRRGDIAMLERGHQEDRVDLGGQAPVGVRQLQLELEVAHRP